MFIISIEEVFDIVLAELFYRGEVRDSVKKRGKELVLEQGVNFHAAVEQQESADAGDEAS